MKAVNDAHELEYGEKFGRKILMGQLHVLT